MYNVIVISGDMEKRKVYTNLETEAIAQRWIDRQFWAPDVHRVYVESEDFNNREM